MLRSRLLLPAEDNRKPSVDRICVWLGCERMLCLTALGIVLAPLPLTGQTDSLPGSDRPASPQSQICDSPQQSDPHNLSLTFTKTPFSNEGTGAVKQQLASPGSAESLDQDLKLPEVKRSSSAPQAEEPICKKNEKETEPGRVVPPPPKGNPLIEKGTATPRLTVSYTDGKLTIDANNDRLGDVIEAIRLRVGLSVELPAEPMDDRVFDHVGPAPLRDALTQFLYGSGLNYVIQTSYDDPQSVTKLILSSQPHLVSTRPTQHVNQPTVDQAEAPALYGGAGFASETPGEPIQPVPVPAQPTPSASNVAGVPAGFNVQQAAAASGKTTGQILDELQKQQLQALDAQNPPQ